MGELDKFFAGFADWVNLVFQGSGKTIDLIAGNVVDKKEVIKDFFAEQEPEPKPEDGTIPVEPAPEPESEPEPEPPPRR